MNENEVYMYGKLDDADRAEQTMPQNVAAKNFRVHFVNFGDLRVVGGRHDFGQHVLTTTLPSLRFHCRNRMNEEGKSWITADSAQWSPLTITLADRIDNDMMSQVIRQSKKQLVHGPSSFFTVVIDLLDKTKTGIARRYVNSGCTILAAEHDRELDCLDPSTVGFIMHVQPNEVEILDGEGTRLSKSWMVDVEADDPVPNENPLYEPIKH